MARNPLQIGSDDGNALSLAPWQIGDPTDPMAVANAQAGVAGVDALGAWLAAQRAKSEARATPFWNVNNPVGTETTRPQQRMGMPDPSFRPGVFAGGGTVPMSAEQIDAFRRGSEDVYDQASLLAGVAPATGGARTVSLGARRPLANPPPSRAPEPVVEPPGLLAYHGSPHQFDAFDMSKIGTGEGAQAYGHGMYLAENEGVARSYRDQLAKDPRDTLNEYLAGIRNFHDPGDPAISADAIRTGLARHDDLAMRQIAADPRSVNDIVSVLRGYDAARGSHTDEAMNAFARLDKVMPPKSKGHMYEVSVNAAPKRFLHWDKPLSEQHPDVQKALVPHVQRAIDLEYTTGSDPLKFTGGDAYSAAQSVMPSFDTPVAVRGAGAAELSAKLKEAGVPGIRYLDQGSRGAGEGSHNYVVFDANTMNIIRRYGLAGLMAGGGAAATQQRQPNALQAQ